MVNFQELKKLCPKMLRLTSALIAVAVRYSAGAGSLVRLSRTVARGDFKTCDQQGVHDLVIIGFVVAVKEHFTPAGSQGDVIFVFHQQPAAIGHINHERAKGPFMKQSSDLIRFHVSNDSQSLDSSKARKHMAGWDGHDRARLE
jgi:hypothetical protein